MATNVRDVIREAERQLDQSGIKTPRNDALVLLSTVAGHRIETLLTHPELQVQPNHLCTYWEWIERRAHHYPLQYLIGRQEFFGRSFTVSPSVLIPRPETEIVVQACLDFLIALERPGTALDIGAGSGCIVLTLLCEIPSLTATAIDISGEVLQIVDENSRKLGCADRLELLKGSTVDPLRGTDQRFDLVVSNPPYVAPSESVDPEVAYEPKDAVFAGPSGFEVYGEILSKAQSVLASSGRLILEAGYGQAEKIATLGRKSGWHEIDRRPDLAGIDRCLVFQRRGSATLTR